MISFPCGMSDVEKLTLILENLVEKSGGKVNPYEISDAIYEIEVHVLPIDIEFHYGDYVTRVEEE